MSRWTQPETDHLEKLSEGRDIQLREVLANVKLASN